MRRLVLIICVLLGLSSCDFDSNGVQGKLIDFIPPKSVLILESENLSQSVKALTGSKLFQNNASLPLFKNLQNNFKFTSYFDLDTEAFLAVTPIGERELATSLIIEDKYLQLDSLQLKKQTKLDYAGKVISEFKLDKATFYSTLIDKVRISSESKLIIENVIRAYNNQFKFDEIFYNAHKAATGETSVFINLKEANYLYKNEFNSLKAKSLKGLGKWLSVDLEVSKGSYRWSGAILSGEESKKLDLFNGISPSTFRLHEVTPANASGFLSLSFSDFKKLQENRATQNYTASSSFKSMFQNTREVGAFEMENGALVYDMISSDVTKTLDSLSLITQKETSFRNQTIYSFAPENVFADFSPLLSNHKFSVFTVYDSHFLFAKNQEVLESVLININNRSVLSESSSFQDALEKMSTSAHMVWGGQLNAILEQLEKSAAEDFLDNLKNFKTEGYSSLMMQATQEDNFAFVHGILSKDQAETKSDEAIQVSRIKLENTITSDPYFFTNWRTRQKDIVVQDETNTLHLIAKDGKTIWTKAIDSRLVGDIHTFDIYRNTRLQMAFTTQNKLYVVDKNANNVDPFPLDFNDFISEGLAIFDYDNNGKYRFVVVQNDEVLMFNKEGKLVKGFDYKAQGDIKRTPKHIRIGRRDYILVENDRGLKILNRTGSERIKPKQKILTSGNEFGLHNSSFVGTNKDGDLLEISENGAVKTTELNLSDTHFITVSSKHIVTFSENKLSINGVSKTLDYGLYLPPQIHEQAKRTYFSIVDQQASKVYLFNEQAELVSGFPVFGNSQIDLDLKVPNEINFIVKGDDNAILIYNKKL
ncbi:hypothetical protein [Psychroflexus sediminis]|uniref:Uncharacterized protein n=1 Tax=Psychroflexus sediminis TaxID=470826 RepID=A0A1G7VWI7_9FLAO|nr:hypothetical protein [Psychroflexus sediminis]SDG63961.1 hypothetical protein SAMN04488027_104209 [Psychroflexus sediminis]